MKEAFPVGYPHVKSAHLIDLELQLARVMSSPPGERTLFPPADPELAARSRVVIANLGINIEDDVSRANVLTPNMLQSAFYRGAMTGLFLWRLIYPEVRSLQFCLQQLVNVVRDANDHRQRGNEVAQDAEALMTELGQYGLGRIKEARALCDAVIDTTFTNPSEAIVAKVGFGLGILLYQESAGQESATTIAQHADAIRYIDDATFAAEVAALLSRPVDD